MKTAHKETEGKNMLHLVPTLARIGVGWVMTYGVRKYGEWDYLEGEGIEASKYYAAAQRHLDKWWTGEDLDEESGLHHLWHAAACIMMIYDTIVIHPKRDDRFYKRAAPADGYPPSTWQNTIRGVLAKQRWKIPDSRREMGASGPAKRKQRPDRDSDYGQRTGPVRGSGDQDGEGQSQRGPENVGKPGHCPRWVVQDSQVSEGSTGSSEGSEK